MLRKMYESSELLKCVWGKMPNFLVYLSKRNPFILLKYTPKDSSSSSISHISLCIRIGPLGSLHHPD